jgi:hypothetical protein
MALEPTQPPIQWVRGALSLGVKRPGLAADHLVPKSRMYGRMGKYVWSYTSTPQYVFMAWCSVKHRDNFTFTFISVCILSHPLCDFLHPPVNSLKVKEERKKSCLGLSRPNWGYGRPQVGNHWHCISCFTKRTTVSNSQWLVRLLMLSIDSSFHLRVVKKIK